MIRILVLLSALMVAGIANCDSNNSPPIRLVPDGFPTGHDTPEGVASDLARAFITGDREKFLDTCLKPFGGGESRKEYENFLEETGNALGDSASSESTEAKPKGIGKVFAARHLTSEGPASYAYAVFDFQDVMFVDVGVLLSDGRRVLNRTFVVKLKDGSWYVHPIPQISPLLSAGLNEEGQSIRDFSEAYKDSQ